MSRVQRRSKRKLGDGKFGGAAGGGGNGGWRRNCSKVGDSRGQLFAEEKEPVESKKLKVQEQEGVTAEERFWESLDHWDPEYGRRGQEGHPGNVGHGGNKVALEKAMALLAVSPLLYPAHKDVMTLRLLSSTAT